MRSIYVTYGDSAKMIDVGFDLMCEVGPGKWVKANKLPQGMLEQENKFGTLKAGIAFNGQVRDKFNIKDMTDRQALAANGIDIGDDTGVSDVLGGLITRMNRVAEQIPQAKQDQLDDLDRRAERLSKEIEDLQKNSQGENMDPVGVLDELARSFKIKSREGNNLEALFKIQAAVDFTTLEPGNALMEDPGKLKRLRRIFMELA